MQDASPEEIRWWELTVLGTVTLLGAALACLVMGLRIPQIHDEFAYLLLGETFASGRLTNPTPDHWPHLETYHVLMEPTYTAKYPPGQGLVIALGILLGHPIIGVWLTSAAMVVSAAWMFGAILPRRMALVGAFGVILQVGIASAWTQAYWGGALAATGGALLYGSLMRAWSHPSIGLGGLIAAALIILANTRPMEGLLVSLPAAFWVLADKRPWRLKVPFWLGLSIPLVLGFCAMGLYNKEVTGDPLKMPYQEYQSQYGAAPVLLISSPREEIPEYRHRVFEEFWHNWERDRFESFRQPRRMLSTRTIALAQIIGKFLGFGALGLLFLVPRLRDPWMRTVAVAAGLGLAGTLLSKGAYSHYLAPAFPLFALLALKGWQEVLKSPSPRSNLLAFAALVGTLWVPVIQIGARIKVGRERDPTVPSRGHRVPPRGPISEPFDGHLPR